MTFSAGDMENLSLVKESPMFHNHDPFNGTKKQPTAARVQFYL